MFNTPQKMFPVLMIFISACGTYVGNGIGPITIPTDEPRAGSGISEEDFLEVENEYKSDGSSDCGMYTENSTDGELENGRACIVHAQISCEPSKYLYNKTNPDGSRFVSYVGVAEVSPGAGECEIYVHTLSNVPGHEINDAATCASFTEDQIPELACGIGHTVN